MFNICVNIYPLIIWYTGLALLDMRSSALSNLLSISHTIKQISDVMQRSNLIVCSRNVFCEREEHLKLQCVLLLMAWHCGWNICCSFILSSAWLKMLSACVCLWRSQHFYQDVSIWVSWTFKGHGNILHCSLTHILKCLNPSSTESTKSKYCIRSI